MKKVFRIIMYSLLFILLLGLIISYVRYRNYWPDDGNLSINEEYLSYFKETYEDCRNEFRTRVIEQSLLNPAVESGNFKVPGKADDDLTVDWCYIPARGEKEKLLILNSGLHGIEGYTGSAIQNMFLDNFTGDKLSDNTGVLLIHGLNPYGFKYRRKVTENNVDLNRNCVNGQAMSEIENEGYKTLTGMLMPAKEVNYRSIKNRFFYLVAIYKIIQESMPVLRQAALQGQYEFEKGIYYGGEEYEPQIELVKPLISEKIAEYNIVLNVDLHTAYGERGKMHLFINPVEDKVVYHGIEAIFKDTHIDWGNSADFYTINGEYITWANKLVPDKICLPMLFEFGTLDSQETFGSLKSIQIMILENQGAHYGYKSTRDEQMIKYLFDEMYYPTSAQWRSKVMTDAADMINKMMSNFSNYQSLAE